MTTELRPGAPAFLADPFATYARLRDDDPAHWSHYLKAWVLTRYDDVKRVCLDSRMSSDRLRPFFASLPTAEAERMGQLLRVLTLWMVFRDPPEHTRLRRLTSRVFNVRSIQALKPAVESLTAWLLERLGERTEFDLIAEFAGPLPALVIIDMLGVPRGELASSGCRTKWRYSSAAPARRPENTRARKARRARWRSSSARLLPSAGASRAAIC